MAETSGETLGGRYRLLGERASFPFGSWWEAEDDQGARTVVLRLHPEVVDPAARTKEALEVSSRIDTPHLVPWADGGVDAKGQGWLAAPMFGPWSLLEHVTRGEGGLPPVEAAPLIHQVVRAVASGEKAGVLHHALTSELIRLVPLPDGGHGIKIYGYGLSQVLPAYKPLLRKQDGYLGVPDYMSPEMCGGKPSEGSSSDIYALGILMYEAVRGRPPFAPTFASASASATLKRHIFEKPLALHVRYANAQHIKSYENICFKALNKTANRRQLAVAELEQELEQLITQEMRVPIVPLSAISGRAPATSRRLRTQVLPSVAAEPAPVASVVVAEDLAEAVEPAEPVEEKKAAESPAPVVAAKPEATQESPAQVQAVSGKGAEDRNKRTEGTLVFAGLGPAVRELAENAKPARAPAEAPVEASQAVVAATEADEGDGEEEGSTEEEALPSSAQVGGGKKGKRKKGRKGSQSSFAAAATVTVPTAKVPAPATVTSAPSAVAQPVATPKSEAATGETAAAAASEKPEPKEARVRRKDDSTAKNPGATDAAAAVALQVLDNKEAVARKDEQEDWFNKEEEVEVKKPASKAWIFLLLAAAVVAVVIFLLTQDKGAPAQPTAPTGAGTGPRYGMADSPKPAQPAPAPAATAPAPAPAADTKPVEAKPAEVAPTPPPTAPPAEVKPVEAKPAEVVPAPVPAPVEAKPAEVRPAEVKPTTVTQPTQVKPAEVKPTTVTKPPEVKPAEVKPTTVTKPAEVKPAEVKPTTVTKPVEVKPAEVKPAEVKPTEAKPGSPEESFKAQAQHYMKLGIDAFKAEKFGQAADYFKRAQAADPSNKAASAYLRRAQEKLAP